MTTGLDDPHLHPEVLFVVEMNTPLHEDEITLTAATVAGAVHARLTNEGRGPDTAIGAQAQEGRPRKILN